MKYLAKDESKCIECGLCEQVCSELYFKVNDRNLSRIKINHHNQRINVCNQCGECIPVCSEEALTRNKLGVVLLNNRKCVGCYVCVGYCPTLSMMTAPGQMIPFKCIACGKCAEACPTGAIYMSERSEV